MIKLAKVSKKFQEKTAVDDISFDIGTNEIVGFLGPNGAGKTTTIRMITGYLCPTAGDIEVNGINTEKDIIEIRKNIGYMSENVPMYHDLRVNEYLKFRAELKGIKNKNINSAIDSVIEKCWLKDVSAAIIGNLSKGFRQRLGLADALLNDPKILILDEPTIGLDPNQIRMVRELIKSLGQDRTILLSSHILPEVEMICNKIIIINKGKILAQDTKDNLLRDLSNSKDIEIEIRTSENIETINNLLKNIKGVISIENEELDATLMRLKIRSEKNMEINEQICAVLINNNSKIRLISEEHRTLEDVFVNLTTSEETTGSAK